MTTTPTIPPGNWGWPILGETLAFLQDPEFAQKRHQRYGPIFKTRLLGNPTIFLQGPEANRFVLTHENQYFQVSWPPSVKALLGPLSLALQTGHEHLQRRKLMAQAFQPRALAGYSSTMVAITDAYLRQWQQQQTLTWYPQLRRYTFDVACKLLVGLDQASATDLGHWFETWCGGLFTLPLNLPWTRFGRAYRCRRLLLQGLEDLIRQRQQAPDPGQDALGILLQARDEQGQGLSLAELTDQVLLLLFAGHETLTSAIASLVLLLAQHSPVKQRARAEQAPFCCQPLTAETLKQMPYLDQVLQEVLRLIAPVGGGFRRILQPCELGGYRLPQGWSVLYQISLTHQDPNLFPDPSRFDPERFSADGASAKPQPFSHLPFGGGVRECLGKEFARLEMKIFAARLLQAYDWELLPEQDLSLVTVPTPHPKDNLRVRLWALP